MKIYLAGGKDSEWRDRLTARWPLHELVDPFKHSRQGALYQFTNDDLAHVASSQLLIGYCTYHQYTGTALEFGYAHALEIPILYIAGTPRVDSMMASVATAVFTDFHEAIDWAGRKWKL